MCVADAAQAVEREMVEETNYSDRYLPIYYVQPCYERVGIIVVCDFRLRLPSSSHATRAGTVVGRGLIIAAEVYRSAENRWAEGRVRAARANGYGRGDLPRAVLPARPFDGWSLNTVQTPLLPPWSLFHETVPIASVPPLLSPRQALPGDFGIHFKNRITHS